MTPSRSTWSLWDMLRFYAENFMKITETLTHAEVVLHLGDDKYKAQLCSQKDIDHLNVILDDVKADLTRVGLTVSLRVLSTQREFINTSATFGEVVGRTTHVRETVKAELSTCLLVHIDPKRSEFYTERDLFGETVTSSFPSALYDIEEAGKCLSLDRGTASVFHLMRVMEVGVRALGTTLKHPIDPKTNPSWENILGKCDGELRKKLADRSAEWKIDDQFFSQATANLRAVKDAWRNPTMHVGKKYTDEEAVEVFTAVRAFMRHLSIKLAGPPKSVE